jgi:hypothetical protein
MAAKHHNLATGEYEAAANYHRAAMIHRRVGEHQQANLAWQSLETLLGYKADRNTINQGGEEAQSRLKVRAPFDGTIES